jgi:Flp pilus assembly protein TadD
MPNVADLEAMTKKTKKPLPWYGLAMEYRNLGRFDDAVQTFVHIHELAPHYAPAYFMCAQVHAERGDNAAARASLVRGIEAARASQDDHAEGEMRSMLQSLGEP